MTVPIVSLLVISFVSAVVLTPRVAAVAERFDILDRPSARKVHSLAVPRIGGVSIFAAFFISICLGLFFTDFRTYLCTDNKILFVFVGGILAFCLGFIDDIKRLGPKTKFSVQIIAALSAYMGGIQINALGLPGLGLVQLGWLSLPVTVFWVLLVINAINLIDGLDGLAAGVSFFVCIVILALSLIHNNGIVAIVMAALAGSILGFLIFNFNPASIFMGDCGSYFLGYMLASLSIYGSLKSHTAFTFLIPVIAMGVPLMDTIWATLRRFILGQKLFYPDRDHFHHRLLKLGYSHRRAVLVLYGITIGLGCLAFMMVNIADSVSAYFLLLPAVLIIFFIRRLGYLNFLGLNSLLAWMNDLVNALGINRDRRAFFAYQLAVLEAPDMKTFWERIVATAEFLGLDYIEMKLGGEESHFKKFDGFSWYSPDGAKKKKELYANQRLYMRFPLEYEGQHFGVLMVSKRDFDSAKFHSQTLWRLEFLRRTFASALHTFKYKPEFQLYDRRKNYIRDRRIHEVKHSLIRELEKDKRINGGDRRKKLILMPS
ncbi:MAG: undecaprenyl/decaprenyl-phosphate alpha-N-acetylglucosaminyl 1-phosphate transferase [Desulfobulbaceae bacterium]|nr:undecaprenyl/decaprenyl-phosphate alpha-N-acetylglucosaminyl 1-phosphate transferase [Desulfobulbaceae bacterium]